MINLLLGAPGGGKSYEATVFHILPALEKGRKVITNLPLIVEKIAQIDAAYADLIELRTQSKGEGMQGKGAEQRAWRPFEHESDYGDTWRRNDGVGPLYVIDECHLALPKGETRRAVEEWYSLHRHENADVLLITQSYGKVSAAVRDLVQIVYRVRKNVALGSMGSYTRKVQDGLRGEVVNTSIRKYEKRYFGLYKSHTKGKSAEEMGASDVRPIWKNWTFIGAAICLLIVLYMLASGKFKAPWVNDAASKVKNAAAETATPKIVKNTTPERRPAEPTKPVAIPASGASSAEIDAQTEPYAGRGVHLTGFMEMNGKRVWSFLISQNGQAIASITDAEISAAGYRWKGDSQCSGTLYFKSIQRVVLCDAPQIGPNIPAPKIGG